MLRELRAAAVAALTPVLTSALTLALIVAALPAAPDAMAQTGCAPAGGQAIPDPATLATGDFVVVGGGWGHGVGMSQYGAQGAAKLGCSATEILQTYYPGITLAQAPTLPETFKVSLWPDRPGGTPPPAICLRAHTGSPAWQNPDNAALTQPNGTLWRVDVAADGAYSIREFTTVDACRAGLANTGTAIWSGGSTGALLRVPLDGPTIVQLTSKSTDTTYSEGRPYAHGTMEFSSIAGGMYLTLVIDTYNNQNALERYLRGLSEMPSSWEPAALQAQAITGRSYALDKWEAFKGNRSGCRCDVYDSTSDQVYAGYMKEADTTYGQRWITAVDATAGKTMRYGSKTAVGYYSSSHGGHSESNRFVWGSTQVAYLQPVDDSRWDLASSNPLRRWSTGLSKEQIGSAFGVGVATDVTTPAPFGAGGRIGSPNLNYGGVKIVGTTGTKTVSGDNFRSTLGLRSTLFTIRRSGTVNGCAATGASTAGVTRHSGGDRVGTAVAVSQANWPAGTQDALLATSENYPDALASASLAAALNAPLLLTPGKTLAAAVKTELARLGVKTVWVLGGTAAVSTAVTDQLVAANYTVRRVAGVNRFETARRVALEPSVRTVGTVALAMDQDWPSAVAAGALAATPARIPTLLVHQDRVPDVTERTLAELQPGEVILVGGLNEIGNGVAARLTQLGYTVRRLSGETRYATSAVVAAEVARLLPPGRHPLVAATGKDFPDALAAGALAARLGGPLLLTPQCTLDDAAPSKDFITDNKAALSTAALVGGSSALSDRVAEQISAALTQ